MNSGPSGSNHNKIPKYKNFRHFLIYLRTIKTIALTKIKKKIQFFLSVFPDGFDVFAYCKKLKNLQECAMMVRSVSPNFIEGQIVFQL